VTTSLVDATEVREVDDAVGPYALRAERIFGGETTTEQSSGFDLGCEAVRAMSIEPLSTSNNARTSPVCDANWMGLHDRQQLQPHLIEDNDGAADQISSDEGEKGRDDC
jgi:hypothetical protein